MSGMAHMSVLCSIQSICFAVLFTKPQGGSFTRTFQHFQSLGMGDGESMHFFRNKILMQSRGASEVLFMRREFCQVLIFIGGLRKDLEDVVNS